MHTRDLIDRAQPYCLAAAFLCTLCGAIVLAGERLIDGASPYDALQHAGTHLELAFGVGLGQVGARAAVITAILLPVAAALRAFFGALLKPVPSPFPRLVPRREVARFLGDVRWRVYPEGRAARSSPHPRRVRHLRLAGYLLFGSQIAAMILAAANAA